MADHGYTLNQNLHFVFDQVSKTTVDMGSISEAWAFLLGVYKATEAFFNYANVEEVGIVGREQFMASLRTHIYNEMLEIDFDTAQEIKKAMTLNDVNLQKSFESAARLQVMTGKPLSAGDVITLKNLRLLNLLEH